MKISKGDIVNIKKEKYDVLSVIQEFDLGGECLEMELHKFGESTLHPTHLLKIYKDKPKSAILINLDNKDKKDIPTDRIKTEQNI